jgi:hypothetical protein
MEPATCSKKPLARTSLTRSPTRSSIPSRLSLDVDESTHPPSTCYEDAHPTPLSPTSPTSPRSHTFPIPKRKHKNRESVDSNASAASHDSFTTAHESHAEGEDGEKHGILHKVATGMHKARPYVERLSGTYEPMPVKEPDHTK